MTEDRELRRQNAASAVDWSIECVRAALVLNGAAILIVLAFYPHEVGDGHVEAAVIRHGLSNYIFGALTAFAGAGVAYLAQRISAEAVMSVRRWVFPGLNGAGAFLVLGSFLLFASGSFALSSGMFPDTARKSAELGAGAAPAQAQDLDAGEQPTFGF